MAKCHERKVNTRTWAFASCNAALLLTAMSACARTMRHETVRLAQDFRSHQESDEFEAASAMMSEDPRRWFDEVEGAGMAWQLGASHSGPWAAWDAEFEKQTRDLRWSGDGRSATLTFQETNDYFRLLDRGWVTTQLVYLFDESSRIQGLLIRAVGERQPGRTDEFLTWARAKEPEELEYLHPNGEIDPRGDRPARYRALLKRWRRDAGLPEVEPADPLPAG